MNEIISFIVVVAVASSILQSFYSFQRKFFSRTYYSFFELITGLPSGLSFYQLFFIKFIPPFLISFLSYYFFNRIIELNFLWYSLIGVFTSLINTIPAILDIKFYKGLDEGKIELRSRMSSLYLVYFQYIASFLLLSGLGAYFASLLGNFDFSELLPSKHGIIDGLWIVLIIAILNKLNKPL